MSNDNDQKNYLPLQISDKKEIINTIKPTIQHILTPNLFNR